MASPAVEQIASGPSQAYREANRARFETDLEFVQCLANPLYLQTLAQQSLLSSPSFQAYLSYLSYFRAPAYSKFIHYPQALHHLELLSKSESFREALRNDATVGELARIQVDHWRTWRERLEGAEEPEEEKVQAGEAEKAEQAPS